jgi:predicted negative regulator of RcsB-dependent stress response
LGAAKVSIESRNGSVSKNKEKGTKPAGSEAKQPHLHTGSDAGDRAIEWVKHHQKRLTIGAVAVTLLGFGVWFTRAAQFRKEGFAARELSQARFAAGAGNFQLAASDLSRIITSYGSTPAGQEAVLLLANVHMEQQQPGLAAAELQDFLDGGTQREFTGPAAGLLASALEEMGDLPRAADAYDRAIEATPYALIRNDYLMDLGRVAWAIGDTARAAEAYERVIEESEDAPAVSEATFRLAEMRRASAR